MSQSYPELIDDLNAAIGKLREGAPDPMRGFSALAREALKPGALDVKTKELIAIGIAIATRCDGCIGFHAKALVDLGATREEIAELMAMTVYMGGGPALMYAADALRAYDQFTEAKKAA